MTTNANTAATLTLTDESFAREIDDFRGLALVDFWAEWCGPCRVVGPIVEQLARDYAGRVRVGKLDVDANPRMAARFGVRSIPTLLIFKDGALVDGVVGAVPRAVLEGKLRAHL